MRQYMWKGTALERRIWLSLSFDGNLNVIKIISVMRSFKITRGVNTASVCFMRANSSSLSSFYFFFLLNFYPCNFFFLPTIDEKS
jgi:hypothetical protein